MIKNNKIRLVVLYITILGIITIVVATFVSSQADVRAVDTKTNVIESSISELKVEGCLPARDNGNSITRIETQLETMQLEQRTAFTEILKRLPE